MCKAGEHALFESWWKAADMDRLFRDWRYALLWVIGISAMATAYFAEGGGYEDLQARSAAQSPPGAPPAAVRASSQPSGPNAVALDEKAPRFGDPVLDTTPFDPNPVEAGAKPVAVPVSGPADSSPPAAAPASEPAPVAP